jgi:hypothetical protein
MKLCTASNMQRSINLIYGLSFLFIFMAILTAYFCWWAVKYCKLELGYRKGVATWTAEKRKKEKPFSLSYFRPVILLSFDALILASFHLFYLYLYDPFIL